MHKIIKHKLLEENIGNVLFDLSLRILKWDNIKWNKLFLSEGNSIEKAVYWMGEDICKWHIWQVINILKYIKNSYKSAWKKQPTKKMDKGPE